MCGARHLLCKILYLSRQWKHGKINTLQCHASAVWEAPELQLHPTVHNTHQIQCWTIDKHLRALFLLCLTFLWLPLRSTFQLIQHVELAMVSNSKRDHSDWLFSLEPEGMKAEEKREHMGVCSHLSSSPHLNIYIPEYFCNNAHLNCRNWNSQCWPIVVWKW